MNDPAIIYARSLKDEIQITSPCGGDASANAAPTSRRGRFRCRLGNLAKPDSLFLGTQHDVSRHDTGWK